MCYKVQVQKHNEEKLQKIFDNENVPIFIQRYFINISSGVGRFNYWIAIKDLLQWLMDNKVIDKSSISELETVDFTKVESEDITLYLHQKENKGMSPTTLETRKNIFSSFWNYLERSKSIEVDCNIIKSVSYKGISSNNNLVKKLPTDEQINQMLKNISYKKDSFIRDRNNIVLRVLKGSGIRLMELANLDLNDLFLEADIPYITVLGKGNYRDIEKRIVYITNDCKEAFIQWLDIRNCIPNIVDVDAIFINKNGGRLSEENIKAIFKNYGNGVTPHMIRHYYATIMASKGNVVFAQQQLGHSSLNTTINNYANGSIGMKNVLENL